MLTGLAALENIDWSRLLHAYGRATDTPGHLRALLEEDRKAREKAMDHLWSAIIHQGTPWTATAPAALVVVGLLTDERIDRGESIRAALLSFLVSVAEAPAQAGVNIEELEAMAAFDIEPFTDAEDVEALYEDVDAANALWARALLGCISITPALMQTMLEALSNRSARVRTIAAMGAVTLAKLESLRSYANDLEARLLALAQAAAGADERSAYVLALGDLGYAPTAFLADSSPAVRMCAALAPSLADDPVAIAELLNALERHAGEIDDWFVQRPPEFCMRPRFWAVARLVQQVKDFDRLVNAAIAVVEVSHSHCVDHDWGPLLGAAFADGDGIAKTAAQRRFLAALVRRSELWVPRSGNAERWFSKAGLPYNRQECARRVAEADSV